jgi:hypothetical protein
VAVAAGAGGIPSAATDDDGNQTCCAPDPMLPIWAAARSVAVAVGAVPKDRYERQVDRECRLVACVESTGRAREPMPRQRLSTHLPGSSACRLSEQSSHSVDQRSPKAMR